MNLIKNNEDQGGVKRIPLVGWTFCSGIGCPELAAPWADWRLASEIEPFPREVLRERFGYQDARHHNSGPRLWGDMSGLKVRHAVRLGIPMPDLIVAGTPCQSFSVAGPRQGTADARGNLTLQFVRICHAIVNARPDGQLVVVWENVPGILSDKGNAFGSFLGGLVGAVDALPSPGDGSWPGEGMVQGPRARAAWSVLDAQWFGVAQRRRRVFVVVDFGGACDPAQILLEPDSLRGDSPPRREAGKDVAGTAGKGASHWSGGPHPALNQYHNTGGIGASNQELFSQGGADLVPDRVEGHHGDIAGTVSSKWSKGSGAPAGDETQNMVAFDCKGTEVQHDASGGETPLRSMGHNKSHQNAGGHAAIAIQERAGAVDLSQGPQGAVSRTDDCAYTIEARNKVQAVAFDLRGRDEGAQVESVGETDSLRAADGGSSRSYVAVGGDVAHSLTGEGHDASEDGSGRGTPVVAFAENQQGADRTADVAPALSKGGGKPGQGYSAIVRGPVVRRLTPTECARLQGGPDDHIDIMFRGKPATDGHKYKAWGNGMAIPVVRWILDRVHAQMRGD